MTSNRPYLLRALYEWIAENGMTPHILVNAELTGVQVPTEFVHDGRIILNIAPSAVQGLALGNEQVEFNARFGGVPRSVTVPMFAVLAIYARENGRGMVFPEDDTPPPSDPGGGGDEADAGTDRPPRGRPSLKVVK